MKRIRKFSQIDENRKAAYQKKLDAAKVGL
jgi:hypothetical protein